MNRREGIESFLSTEGLRVIAALFLAGSLLVFLTGSATASIVLVLFALGTGAWAWARGTQNAHPPTPAREPRPSPVSNDAPAPRKPPPPPTPDLLKRWEAMAPEEGSSVGPTVRLDSLTAIQEMRGVAHLTVTGDGPPRDLWFGRSPDEPWPSEVSIGRLPEPGQFPIVISSKAVSALQARLVRQDNAFLIENLSQTNATRVNGRPLLPGERRPMADGDRIEMGPVTISYRLE